VLRQRVEAGEDAAERIETTASARKGWNEARSRRESTCLGFDTSRGSRPSERHSLARASSSFPFSFR
jgi:hypothetical protein